VIKEILFEIGEKMVRDLDRAGRIQAECTFYLFI